MNELVKLVGKPYQEFDEDGNYIGCFEPMYFLYPHLPKFRLPENKEIFFNFALGKIEENFNKIPLNEICAGDIVVFRQPNNILHLGVYLGSFRLIHTYKKLKMMINKIDLNNKRIIGGYRFTL
jgi:hypothetical protein